MLFVSYFAVVCQRAILFLPASSATAFGRQNSPRSIGQKPKRLVTGQAKPSRITWDVCPCPWIQQQFEWESPDLCSSNRWNKVSSFCPISPISLFSSLFLIKILQEFLTRKLHNLPLPNNAIVEIDVYDHQPWFYASGHNYGMDQYETYYFVRREKKSKSKFETAKNPKRHLKSDGNSSRGGWWKAITGDKPIHNKRGHIIGFKKTLKFCTYKDQKYDRRECVKTDWIMHEYKLSHPTFQEWVVCGIRYNGGKGTGQEYALGCHSILDHASGHRQEREEDQQSQTQQDSPYDKVCNASSQLNMGSDRQCCWANAQEYFGLNEQEYASGCYSTLDNQRAQDSNKSLEFIYDPSWNEFEDTEGSQVQFPQISFTGRDLEDGGLYFDLWT